jgi:hypothetical protein
MRWRFRLALTCAVLSYVAGYACASYALYTHTVQRTGDVAWAITAAIFVPFWCTSLLLYTVTLIWSGYRKTREWLQKRRALQTDNANVPLHREVKHNGSKRSD